MYRELGKASRANSKKSSGCMTLLQSWIYEYFLSLRGADGNICLGYMEWYLLRTHPYIVPASLAAACDGVLSERVSI
ncbi:hypothetical protein LINGRAHAP2_LOCUS24997 [Linum grandiflorum]